MAVQVASLFGVLSLKDEMTPGLERAKGNVTSFGSRLDNLGSNVTKFGANMTAATAPLAAAFGVAVNSAKSFDEAVTNTGAVLGMTRDEITALSAQLLDFGSGTRAGPQAVAEAYYDIAGGVADASTHMSILRAAVATSEAGNAKLAGTTKALISVMNSYKLSASQAAFASDVLTRTVGMGVGSMDEFASALPSVTGLANSLGISLDDLGGMMAYLTTQGNSASEAATQLAAMMTAVVKPNDTMLAALQELGYASGEAAIEALGLMGAYQALAQTQTASTDGMAAMLGTTEALRGATALAGPEVANFLSTFKSGVEGATEAARQVQMQSAAAQFDLLQSSISEAAIKVGQALLPALVDLAGKVQPIVDDVVEWIGQNPELVSQIGQIAMGAAALGGVLVVAGTIISAIGSVAGVAAGGFALLTNPVVLLVGAIAALVFAASTLYPGGLSQLLSDAADSAQKLGAILSVELLQGLNDAAIAAGQVIAIVGFGFNLAVASARTLVDGLVKATNDWIDKNFLVFNAISSLALAIGIGIVLMKVYSVAVGAVAAVKLAAATASGGFAGALALVKVGITALSSPLVVLIGLLTAAIALFRQLEHFQKTVGNAQQSVASAHGAAIQSGAIDKKFYEDTAFKATQAQFGGGFFGDLAARFAWDNPSFRGMLMQPYNANAAQPSYAVGTDFVPETGPAILHRGEAVLTAEENANRMSGMNFAPGSIVIYANSDAEGRAAANGFEQRIKELRMARGGA